jgi:hypothetical protein
MDQLNYEFNEHEVKPKSSRVVVIQLWFDPFDPYGPESHFAFDLANNFELFDCRFGS